MRAVSNKTRIETLIFVAIIASIFICMRAVSNKTRIETIQIIPLGDLETRMRAVSNKTRIET